MELAHLVAPPGAMRMTLRHRASSWSRRPVVHFLVLGGLLYAADRLVPDSPVGASEAVVVTAQDIATVYEAWQRERGRRPSPEEAKALVEGLVADELLYREARERRYGENDLVVRRRLIDKMAFLSDESDKSRAELYREAIELGLGRDDPIVRRRLIQKMRLEAGAQGGPIRPTQEELRDYYERHRERFMEPARWRLSHVFLSRDKHRDRLGEEAHRLLEKLRRQALSPRQGAALGEAFLLGHHLPPQTVGQLSRGFGESFGQRVRQLTPGAWSGPVESAYGLHLVWVHEIQAPRPVELEAVRARVLEGLRMERREQRLSEVVVELRRRYQVRLEEPPAGTLPREVG